MLSQRYRVRVEPEVLMCTGYLAGADQQRVESFNRYLRDPDVRAIIAIRGGYGSMRILDDLDADALRRDPKLLVGFSDITAVLCWALLRAGVRGIHGPMAAQLGELPAEDVAWLFRLMEQTEAPHLPPMDWVSIGAAPSPGPWTTPIEGPLLGGNLCLLSHLLGTPYQLDYTGAVLFFEEIGERSYRIDRYLTHLGLAGVLNAVSGAVVGELLDCRAPEGHPAALAVVDERLQRHRVPGISGALLAHGTRHIALPFGARCAVDGTSLRLLEPAVA